MSFNRPNTIQENLATGKNFSIDVIVKNHYTHYVQISLQPSAEVLQLIPFEPTDRTVAGCISQETLHRLGDEADNALKILSETLLSKFGVKELMVIPTNANLPAFIAPEVYPEFDRLRHCSREQLYATTTAILSQYGSWATQLDEDYCFVTDEQLMLSGHDIEERYEEMSKVLDEARFTPDKMDEYKREAFHRRRSRILHEAVLPIFMLNKEGKISGMMRALSMGNHFAYLSDEVVLQKILPLTLFSGGTEQEQAQHRDLFLLAYLMNRASQKIPASQHLMIIVASGREAIYEKLGFERFPLHSPHWKAVLKLNRFVGPVLDKMRETLQALPLPPKPATAHVAASIFKPTPAAPAIDQSLHQEKHNEQLDPLTLLLEKRFAEEPSSSIKLFTSHFKATPFPAELHAAIESDEAHMHRNDVESVNGNHRSRSPK